jgi:capsular polysaccharide biosynthesis protein
MMPRWMVGCAGVVISAGLALFIGIALEFLSPVIIDEQHLEDAIPIPCLGSISEIA